MQTADAHDKIVKHTRDEARNTHFNLNKTLADDYRFLLNC